MKHFILFIVFIALPLFLISCTATVVSTGSRYEKDKKTAKEETVKDKEKESPKTGNLPVENKDITSYREKFNFPEGKKKSSGDKEKKEQLKLWYGFDNSNAGTSAQTTIQKPGYRVEVFVTDDLDSANTMRSEIGFKTNDKNVYVIFEPPFYKVKAGDFTSHSDAEKLAFKLNQLGYTDSRVVSDSVNVAAKP